MGKSAKTLLLLCTGIFLSFVGGIWYCATAKAATRVNTPLDQDNPVYLNDDGTVEYQEKHIRLDDQNIYVDGTLDDATCAKYPHVFNDFKEAYQSGAIKNGTSENPMNVWMAPYVYWVDDPDDPEVRQPEAGDTIPYGLWINCDYLHINGLTDNPYNVVLAVNRGQSHGARGNFTMFFINGKEPQTENLTMGNYCCVDLEYPLKPELSREKRTSTITQSQLCLTNGEKIVAKNCNFISRLNSCPFVGGKRILFTDCHFECTDDSLPTSAVYKGCDFDFYSPRPFYNTTDTGSVFLDCEFNILHDSQQYLTKAGGVVAIIDSTFHLKNENQYVGWTANPSNALRCYEGNVRTVYSYIDEEGAEQEKVVENYGMDVNAPYATVNISGKEAMDAYRFEYNGEVVYNVYNLLKGTDGWDPLDQQGILERASQEADKNYLDLPVMLKTTPETLSITDGNKRTISTSIKGFSAATSKGLSVTWEVEESLRDYITLEDKGDGKCEIVCRNNELNLPKGMIWARDASGLEAGVYVTATPKTQPAPTFTKNPVLKAPENGIMTLEYALSNQDILTDISNIKWYRCSDAAGTTKINTAVTQNNIPLKNYKLTYGDVGYYIMAVIAPKEEFASQGKSVSVVSANAVTLEDVKESPYHFETDFSDFAYINQRLVIPGFWTSDVIPASSTTGWLYGEGSVGTGNEGLSGLLTAARWTRLFYTPTDGAYGDMELTLEINPSKTAGQGFGSAGQYLDIFIKMDTTTMKGYALRVERTAASARGVKMSLVKYEGWDKDVKDAHVTAISDAVMTSVFNATCTIKIQTTGTKIKAEVTTTHSQSKEQANEGLLHSVSLQADMESNPYGGFGMYSTGTVSEENRLMFRSLSVDWAQEGTQLQEPRAYDLTKSLTDPEEEEKPDDKKPDDSKPDEKQEDNKSNGDNPNTSDKGTQSATGTSSQNGGQTIGEERDENSSVAKKKTIAIKSVKAKKKAKKVTGTVSVKKATVKVKVGKKKYKKARVSGKKFSLKLSNKLKKGTKIKIQVSKKGYKTITKTYKVK